MPENLESGNIDQLMVEADLLIQQIHSDFIKEMKEEQRLNFESHVQKLKKIRFEVQRKIDEKKMSEVDSGADGMHEAIQDIVKAMRDLTKYLL
jgi:hypothetical protein